MTTEDPSQAKGSEYLVGVTTSPESRASATRCVARHARSLTDCSELLAMLDLHPREGLREDR